MRRLDHINQKYVNGKYIIPNKKRKRRENIINTKISNMIDDLHWKTIKMLTDKYSMILIGDMSVKGITSNDTSNLTNMTKRIGYSMSLYKFRKRLEYKCQAKRIKFKIINERYTSKMCSCCGKIHNNLGGSETFKCNGCKMVLDRDINGARNIYLKSHDPDNRKNSAGKKNTIKDAADVFEKVEDKKTNKEAKMQPKKNSKPKMVLIKGKKIATSPKI